MATAVALAATAAVAVVATTAEAAAASTVAEAAATAAADTGKSRLTTRNKKPALLRPGGLFACSGN